MSQPGGLRWKNWQEVSKTPPGEPPLDHPVSQELARTLSSIARAGRMGFIFRKHRWLIVVGF